MFRFCSKFTSIPSNERLSIERTSEKMKRTYKNNNNNKITSAATATAIVTWFEEHVFISRNLFVLSQRFLLSTSKHMEEMKECVCKPKEKKKRQWTVRNSLLCLSLSISLSPSLAWIVSVLKSHLWLMEFEFHQSTFFVLLQMSQIIYCLNIDFFSAANLIRFGDRKPIIL